MSSCLHAPPSVGTLRLEGLRLPLPMTVTPLSPLRGKLGDLVCKSTAAVQCDASSSSTISVMHSKRVPSYPSNPCCYCKRGTGVSGIFASAS